MHDYMNGHTCPNCGKSGIICTIEDGVCENEGDCDSCIKERVMQNIKEEEYGYSTCKHGFYEGEDCPICEHRSGEHDIEYTGEDWDGSEYYCPLCDGYSDKVVDEILKGTQGV